MDTKEYVNKDGGSLKLQEAEERRGIVTIIYFDSKQSAKTIKRTDMFRTINDDVLMHIDIDACLTCIENRKKEKIIFVTTGKNFANVGVRIENVRQIDGIFIFSSRSDQYSLLKDKIAGTFADDDDLISAVHRHIRVILEQIQVFSFYRRHQRYVRNLSGASTNFLWFHVFKQVILRLPHDEDAKKDMVDASRHYYRDNAQELKRIDEFERSYRAADAIRWYTKNSFLYRLLNKALRTEDIEQMYTFRYFMQDLYSALVDKHGMFREYGEPVTVYRGLRLTPSDFGKLSERQDQLISLNGYLSTSLTRGVAEMYAGIPTPTSDKISVVLQIECDVGQLGDSIIFGYISSESTFRDENEVLFDIGATFQLIAAPIQDENGVWSLKMKATDEGRLVVRQYIEDYLKWDEDESAKIMYGSLLHDLGKYGLCLSYFNKLLAHPEGENVALIHLHIGSVLNMQGDKINEWKHYESAYELLKEIQPKRFYDEALVLLEMSIFCFDDNDNDRALEYLAKFFHLHEQAPQDLNREVARALLIMGSCYENKDNFNRAIECYEQALKIHEQYPDSNHIVQCKVLLAIGNTYRVQCKYQDALVQFQRALDLRRQTLPEQHPKIADCLSFIGKINGDMDNQGEALLYAMRALDMYSKTLPETELNERSSVLVDIGISFASVEAFQLGLKYFHRALKMKHKSLPSNHPDFAVIFEHMAICYSFLDRHLLALRYSLRAYRFRQRIQTSNHLSIAQSLQILTRVYANMGCQNRAMSYLRKAQRRLQKSDVHNDPKCADEKYQIARLKKTIKKKSLYQRTRRVESRRNMYRQYCFNYLSAVSKIHLRP